MKHLFVIGLSLSTALGAMAQNTAKRPAALSAKPAVEAPVSAAPAPAEPAPAAAPTPAPAPEAIPAVPAETPEATVARFFAALQRKEVDGAYDQLTKGTKIAERADD